jgi:hypothetical protein
MTASLLYPIIGVLLLVLTVPTGIVSALTALSERVVQRTRLRRLMRGHGEATGGLTLSEQVDVLWLRLHLPGTPVEWIAGSAGAVLVGATLAQLLFHNWVLDVGVPIDMVFAVAYVVARIHRRTHDRYLAQMATAFHMIATEFNARRNVTAALLQSYPRLPSPINVRFMPAIKMLTGGAAPVLALDRLARDLGPPYGRLFCSTLEQGLSSGVVDSLLARTATMTEEWQVSRKQGRSVVVLPQTIGLLFNVGFFPTAFIFALAFPQPALYQTQHPAVFALGVASVALGFVLGMLS